MATVSIDGRRWTEWEKHKYLITKYKKQMKGEGEESVLYFPNQSVERVTMSTLVPAGVYFRQGQGEKNVPKIGRNRAKWSCCPNSHLSWHLLFWVSVATAETFPRQYWWCFFVVFIKAEEYFMSISWGMWLMEVPLGWESKVEEPVVLGFCILPLRHIGKLSGAPAICWMLGVLCLPVSLAGPNTQCQSGVERRGQKTWLRLK